MGGEGSTNVQVLCLLQWGNWGNWGILTKESVEGGALAFPFIVDLLEAL